MELYKEKINVVEFEFPVGASNITIEYSYNGGTMTSLGQGTQDPVNSMIRTVALPYLPDEGNIRVNWKFQINTVPYQKTIDYDVVTPYVSTSWIERNLLEGAGSEELEEIETAVRHIINAHTGQSFGKHDSILTVTGTGESSLALPERLIAVTNFNGVESAYEYFDVVGDGWYLKVAPRGIPPVKADYYGLHMHRGGVIHNPNNVSLSKFAEGFPYQIDGTWGWDKVPQPVVEAAKLLVNDYAGADSQYRDRYLTSMTAADWRIQFNSGAFARTGNVRADQLLSGYVMRRGWAVI